MSKNRSILNRGEAESEAGNGSEWEALGLKLETDLGIIERTRAAGVSKWPVATLEVGHAVTGDLKTVRNCAVAGALCPQGQQRGGTPRSTRPARLVMAGMPTSG
jgi:hypothetical protein